MASERQIAANRRNAQKSTGPRSAAGKKRSAKNSFRHGLSVPIPSRDTEAQVKDLMRQLSVDASSSMILADVHYAAIADLELKRIEQVRTAIIKHATSANDTFSRPCHPDLEGHQRRLVHVRAQPMEQRPGPLPGTDKASMLPPDDEGVQGRQSIEALRIILSELTRLSRYEKRAVSRRNRALQRLRLANSDEFV